MKVLPSIPTDNIYKFMAISGLWFIAGFIALYIWLVSVQIQLDKDKLELQQYIYSVKIENDIKNRLEAIEEGRPGDNKLDWVLAHYTIEDEKMYLLARLNQIQEETEKKRDSLESTTGELLKLIERWDVLFGLSVYIMLMVGLTWFGFSRWIKIPHSLNEEIMKFDRDLRANTLEKLQLEIEELKKSSNEDKCNTDRRTVKNRFMR